MINKWSTGWVKLDIKYSEYEIRRLLLIYSNEIQNSFAYDGASATWKKIVAPKIANSLGITIKELDNYINNIGWDDENNS